MLSKILYQGNFFNKNGEVKEINKKQKEWFKKFYDYLRDNKDNYKLSLNDSDFIKQYKIFLDLIEKEEYLADVIPVYKKSNSYLCFLSNNNNKVCLDLDEDNLKNFENETIVKDFFEKTKNVREIQKKQDFFPDEVDKEKFKLSLKSGNTKYFLNWFEKYFPEYKILFITDFGSRLYGTNNENSDIDIKFIFTPRKIDLNKINNLKDKAHYNNLDFSTGSDNSKNTNDDIDLKGWSLNYFIEMVAKGIAEATDVYYGVWRKDSTYYIDKDFEKFIHYTNGKLLTKNMSSFFGYSNTQAQKYSKKGDRYNEITSFSDYIKDFSDTKRINDYLEEIKVYINTKKPEFIYLQEDESKRLVLNLLGVMHLTTIKISELKERVKTNINKWGHRAIQASKDKGIDYKAIHHSYRILSEVEELLNTKFITFPLKNAEFLKSIKYDKVNLDLEKVGEELEKKILFLKKIIDNSDLPENINTEFLEDLLKKFYEKKFKKITNKLK